MKFNKLLQNNIETNILVIGDIMLDVYQFGNCSRISPEAPVPVIEFQNEQKMLGGAGNVIKNLVSLGAKCDIISVIGNDSSGIEIIEQLKNINVGSNFICFDQSRKSSVKKRIISSGQQLIRIDSEDKFPVSEEIEDKVLKIVFEQIEKYDLILFSDYSKGLLTQRICHESIKIAKLKGVKTIVDPKATDYLKFYGADLIKPNLKEAESFLNKKINLDNCIEQACIELKELLNANKIVITLAENGIALLDDEFKLINTSPTQVYDVSGAGDTVLATLAVCLANNFSLYDSCDFANKAASIVIKKIGTETTTIEEILNLINYEN